MDKKNKDFLYLKICLIHLIKSEYVLIIGAFIEYLSIYSNIILSTNKIINLENNDNDEPLYYLGLFNLIQEAIKSKKLGNCLLFLLSIVISGIYFLIKQTIITEKMIENISNLSKFGKTFLCNFYEIIYFRIFSIYFINSVIYLIINSIKGSFEKNNEYIFGLYLIILIIYFIIYIAWIIYHMKFYTMWSNMKIIKSVCYDYPFCNGFSLRFDIILLSQKIIICFVQNTKLFFPDARRIIFFFSVCFVVIILLHFALFIYEIHLHHDKFLFYNYNKLNRWKMFLVVFSFATVIIKFFLFQKINFVIYPVLIFSFLSLLFVYFYNFPRYILFRYSFSKSILGVLIFLLSNACGSIEENICKWILHHKLSCKNNFCSICGWLNSKKQVMYQKIKFGEFFRALHTELRLQIKNGTSPLLRHRIFYLEIAEIFDYILANQTQRIVFFVIFYNLVNKYKKFDKSIANQFLFLFEYINKGNEDFLKSYTEFIHSEKLITMISNFVDEYEHFILFSAKSPKNVISIAKKFDKLTNNVDVIKILTTSSTTNYQMLLLRFLYESVIHSPLPNSHDFFDVTVYNEFLDFHYKNDKMLLVKYSLMGNTTVIIKAGGDLKNTANKPLESLFPQYLKNYGISKFIEFINKNNFKDENNIFEFIVKNTSSPSDEYIESFRIQYVLYPSVETDEMIIAGDYIMSYEDLIIFERKGRKDYLYSFSIGMEKLFGFSPSFFMSLRSNGKSFNFSSLFKRKKMQKETSDSQADYLYFFKSSQYINQLAEYIDEISDIPNDTILRLNDIKQFCRRNPEREMKLQKRSTIHVEDSIFFIFYVKNDDKCKKGKKDENTILLGETANPYYTTPYGTNTNTNGNNTFNFGTTMDSMSVSCSSSISSKTSSFATKIKMKKISTIEKTGIKNINLFVRLISSFLIILVIISIIFLSLVVVQDKKFESLFFLFQKYKYYKRGIEIEPLRLFANICLYRIRFGDCINFYSNYSENIAARNPSMENVQRINEVIYYQFQASFSSIQIALYQFQKDSFSIHIDELNAIYNYNTSIYTLEEGVDGNLNTIEIKNNFFDALKVYHNFFSQIIERGNLMKTPIKFVHFDVNTAKLDPDTLSFEDLNNDSKYIYQIILNYPSIHKTIIDVQDMIESGFEKFLNSIENIIIIFFVILVVLHILLYCICFQFIKNYKKVIHQNYCKVIDIISSSIYLNYIHRLIENVRVLKQLYEEKPSSLANKINNDKENYKKAKKEELKQLQQQLPTKTHTSSTSFSSSISSTTPSPPSSYSIYTPIVSPFLKIIIITFTVYFFITVIIFIIMYMMLIRLKRLVEYSNINAALDNYIYDNVNANQFSLLTNISTYELSGYIYGNSSINYILKGISEHYINLKKYELFINKNKDYSLIKDTVDLSCENLHLLNDTSIFLIKKYYDIDLSDFLIAFCGMNPIMEYKDPILIQKEICYLMQRLLTLNVLAEYQQKLYYLYNKEIYVLYNLVLFLNNIVRGYANDVMIPEKVTSISNQFQTAVILCLVFNCLCDIIIALILMFFVMNNMIRLNKIFTKFMKFLDG